MRRLPLPTLPVWLLLLALPLGGCAHVCNWLCKQETVEPSTPPPAEEPRPEPPPPPPPDPQLKVVPPEPAEPPSPLTAADSLFARGELAAARGSYLAFLNGNPQDPESAHALLRLAVIYLQPDGPAYDPSLAARVLDRLISEFPDGPEEPAARALRSLYGRADELQRQLDELKRIDLDATGGEEPQ